MNGRSGGAGTRSASPTARPFKLADLMIIVAALACFAGLAKQDYPSTRPDFPLHFALPAPLGERVYQEFFFWAPKALACATLAWVAIRLSPPRPATRFIARQPGWNACAIGSLVICGAAILGTILTASQGAMGTWIWYPAQEQLVLAVSASVIGVWSPPLWGRRWRAEAHWLDRSGRVIGWAWIVLLGAVLLFEIVSGRPPPFH